MRSWQSDRPPLRQHFNFQACKAKLITGGRARVRGLQCPRQMPCARGHRNMGAFRLWTMQKLLAARRARRRALG
eukprot:9480574-Pyramimonas_sp.AAC.1